MREKDKNLEEQQIQPYPLAQEGKNSLRRGRLPNLGRARDRRPLTVPAKGERAQLGGGP
jgi:hypothetical protein